jgi:predicted transcriptional regulator
MKIITLRIDEEEKARLEQLAEAGDITLSRALREGAALYLREVQGKVHRAKGGEATFHGLRRAKDGRVLSKRSDPTAGEARRAASLRRALYERALLGIREAWEAGEKPAVVLAAIGAWLGLAGEVYVAHPGETGWDWFLRDYCEGYTDPSDSEALRTEIRGALVRGTNVNVGVVLASLEAGFMRLLDDAEHQALVRRAVLPTWTVLERRLAE